VQLRATQETFLLDDQRRDEQLHVPKASIKRSRLALKLKRVSALCKSMRQGCMGQEPVKKDKISDSWKSTDTEKDKRSENERLNHVLDRQMQVQGLKIADARLILGRRLESIVRSNELIVGSQKSLLLLQSISFRSVDALMIDCGHFTVFL
jgi:hypothetical protein